jgi:hypothetical protein
MGNNRQTGSTAIRNCELELMLMHELRGYAKLHTVQSSKFVCGINYKTSV